MIIRFLPDSWLDALLRPLAMAGADANVYVEIMAPDWRFMAALVLAAVLLLAWRRPRVAATPFAVLGLWLVVAFVVWLASSGNGRYFMPGLLVIGPLCIGLAARLPATRPFKMTIAAGIVAAQGWVLYNADPWGSWGLGAWDKAPFFPVELDQQAKTEPATYVTITGISYSLIAPQFHPDSRWVNISAVPGSSVPSADGRRVATLLRASARIKVVVPSRPDHMTDDGDPTPELAEVINGMLSGQRLQLAQPLKCRLLPSRGLATVGADPARVPPHILARMGFWVCDLQYPAARPPASMETRPGEDVTRVFDLVERQCPRYYAPGQTSAARVDGGWLRMYPQADIRLYVMDDGSVYYKYWRAMNPVLVGRADDIRSGAKVSCDYIRGRSGLPWDREI